jgi:DNA-binding Lrp family transcriptional regulator
MAGVDLFAPQAESVVRDSFRRAKMKARQLNDADYELSLDYLGNKQIDDVRAQLQLRYRATQVGGAGQSIEPVAIPLTERYVAEAATAYNRHVARALVDESGEESDATRRETKAMNDHLESIGNDEKMHALDRIVVLTRSCGLWYQARRGALSPMITPANWIYPVASDDSAADPTVPDDYMGFVVALASDLSDASSAKARSYAYLTPAETTYFEGRDAYDMRTILSSWPTPYVWPQVVDTPDARGSVQELPLQMLTLWHMSEPVGRLFEASDPDIATFNREINVQLSVLLDTMRVQGWSTMAMNVMDPKSPPPMISWGSRFALALGPGESAGYTAAPNNYQGIIDALQSIVRMFSIAKRQSPNDFSLAGGSALSGFAKLVDSLPKLESRSERIRRLKRMEEQVAWPRIGAVLRYLGVLSSGTNKLHMRVRFADVEFPDTADEQARKQEHQIKHGLTSAAKILAQRDGVSLEEAEQIVADNLAKQPKQEPAQQPPQQDARAGLLGGLVRKKSSQLGA